MVVIAAAASDNDNDDNYDNDNDYDDDDHEAVTLGQSDIYQVILKLFMGRYIAKNDVSRNHLTSFYVKIE